MTTKTAVWPSRRPEWKGDIPKISSGKTTEEIFRLAFRPTGATIEEMLIVRRDDGKPYDDRKKALIKLLKEIKNAYAVELVESGDNYRFIAEKK